MKISFFGVLSISLCFLFGSSQIVVGKGGNSSKVTTLSKVADFNEVSVGSGRVKNAKDYGALYVEDGKIFGQNNEQVVLRGASLGWHNWWSKYFCSETVEWLSRDWKCNVVRAVIGVEPNKAYLNNPQEAMLRLDMVAQAAIENDLYFLADWHAHQSHVSESVKFFDIVSKKYAKCPNIIYEIFNEPIGLKWYEVKKYALEIIRTIRANDPDNLIIVGTPQWSQDVDVAAEDPIVGYKNILYTLHFYANSHKKSLRDKADKAIAKGLPLFVTECGATDADGAKNCNFEEWNIWHRWMEKNKISWLVWGIFDKKEATALLVPDTDVSNWKWDQLTEWGRFAREKICSGNTQ